MLYGNPWFISYVIILYSAGAVAYVKFRAAEGGISESAFIKQASTRWFRRLISGRAARATLTVRKATGSKGHKRTRSDAVTGTADDEVVRA